MGRLQKASLSRGLGTKRAAEAPSSNIEERSDSLHASFCGHLQQLASCSLAVTS